ncbi:DUF3515 family protein [Planosporangium thailandense]|uniref:DUF3515 family protein n=1 Tax=Planosporangium thailandense TaxID=765197 RepID=A0ABX0Y5U7_9ACTN|nr:DUF3515 family protein [Planosporangium thailandense]NJC73784.1 DUF3515 family protein [Planosporangium thailandense]
MEGSGASRGAALAASIVAIPLAILVGILLVLIGQRHIQGTTGTKPQSLPTTPVTMDVRSLAPDESTACRKFISRLPQSMLDAKRRSVTTGREENAAYGQPAITVRCGVAAPTIAQDETVWNLSGICWVARPARGSTTWTTVDRVVPVQVVVPDSYAGQGQYIQVLTADVGGTLTVSQDIPTGCTANG